MRPDFLRTSRFLLGLSVLAFVVALYLPVERVNTQGGLFAGPLLGWNLFIMSFVGLRTIEEVFTEPGLFFYVLSGALANVLLFFSWAALPRNCVVIWTSGSAVLLASVSLFRNPWSFYGSGYWLWLASMAFVFGAALAKREFRRRSFSINSRMS
jgi:hypothetical protein